MIYHLAMSVLAGCPGVLAGRSATQFSAPQSVGHLTSASSRTRPTRYPAVTELQPISLQRSDDTRGDSIRVLYR